VLSWQITEGHIDVHGQFEPERLVGSFFIEPQAATMSFAGKKEGFTPYSPETRTLAVKCRVDQRLRTKLRTGRIQRIVLLSG
jgi:hypothetical protein